MGYTRLQYIESTGTQYIDTGILAKSGLRIELIAELTDDNQTQVSFFGAKDSGDSNRLSWFYYQNTEMYFYYSDRGYPFVQRTDYAEKHNYLFSDNEVYIDGSRVSFNTSIQTSTFTSSFPMVVFACNQGGTIMQYAKMRLYSMYICDGSSVIAHYVPSMDENNVVCLYDTITERYLYNAGTGNFIAGDIVIIDDPVYQIKQSTLTSFADQARRINGTTDELTLAEMLEIFKGVNK